MECSDSQLIVLQNKEGIKLFGGAVSGGMCSYSEDSMFNIFNHSKKEVKSINTTKQETHEVDNSMID